MTARSDAETSTNGELLDELEQLRTSLESALEEITHLSEDRDRLLRRVTLLSHDLQTIQMSEAKAARPDRTEVDQAEAGQAEEELRVAFEELQVLTEELEVANTSLHQTNQDLDARVEERTRQIREINEALRSTEGSLRTIADLVPDLLWRSDASGSANWFNRRWFDYTGQSVDEPMREGWLLALHPLEHGSALEDWTRAVTTGARWERQQRIRDAAGNYRWFLIRAEPMRDENDAIIAWFAAATDVHDQRTAMDALRQSEVRFRTLIEGMPQLVWRAVGNGQWTWSSPQWADFTGQSEEASRAKGWLEAFHPDDRQGALTAWSAAQETGNLEIEARIHRAEEARHRHFRTRALPVRDAEGHILEWLGTSTDVDDIVQLQAEQEVLVGELQHRTRNLMAVVQTITSRTLKGCTSLQDFHASITDRFDALARVQSLLSRRESGQRVNFDVLIREEISAHVAIDQEGRGEQVTLTGPTDVPLKSATVQTLALALHELATNAVKYGALSQPDGRLEVCWDVREPAKNERHLLIDWRERGVAGIPSAGAPAQGGGYGRELIERALPYQLGARTTYQFEEDGIHCTIDVQVPAGDY